MKSNAPPPASVRLTADEAEQIKKIAEALGVTEHALRHFAIQRLIADWARGWRPKKTKVTTTKLEP